MSDIRKRLVECFRLVFPHLGDTEIQAASQASLDAWDSTAAIMLVNVLEDEFTIVMDFDVLPELDSFEKVLAYVDSALKPA